MTAPHADVGFSITSTPDSTEVEPSVAGPAERSDRSFRVLLVADLDPLGAPDDWSGGRRVRPVRPGEVDALLGEWRPRLDLSVESALGTGPDRLAVEFEVERLRDLTPGGIVTKVPALARLAAARAALADVAAGRLAAADLPGRLAESGVGDEEAGAVADALRSAMGSPDGPPPGALGAPPTSAGSTSAVDRILGLVGGGGSPARPAAPVGERDRLLDSLVRAASEPRRDAPAARAAAPLIEALDVRLRAQVDRILGHPDVRRLEGAWRGLLFVLDRVGRGSPLQVEVLPAGKGALAEALYHQVLLPEHAGAGTPLAAVVVDHAFGPAPPDVALLTDLAETGASLQVPVVVSAAPSVFGLDGPGDWSKLPPPRQALARPEALGLQKLRTRPEAPFLAIAAPEFLLREPYGEGWPDRTVGVEETGRLWAGAALLVAAAMAESARETGWPTHLGGRAVGGLALRQTRMGALPLAAAWSDGTVRSLAEAGFFAFSGPLNRDQAVAGPPVVFGTARTAGSADEAGPSLPGAAFAAIAAHHALSAGPHLAGMDEAAGAAALERRLRSVFGDEPDAVTVQPLPDHETPETRTFGVRLRPPRSVLAPPVGLVLGVDVPKETAPADAAPADAA